LSGGKREYPRQQSDPRRKKERGEEKWEVWSRGAKQQKKDQKYEIKGCHRKRSMVRKGGLVSSEGERWAGGLFRDEENKEREDWGKLEDLCLGNRGGAWKGDTPKRFWVI